MQATWSARISRAFSGVTKISVVSGVRSASVKPCGLPAAGALQIGRRQIDEALARADAVFGDVLADRLGGVGDLAFVALAQFLDEAVVHRAGIEAGRAEPVEEDVALLQRQQPLLPGVADRAFLGQQRAGAELEGDRAELGIVDPVLPFLQPPDAAGHDDRRLVAGRTRASACAAPARAGTGPPAWSGPRCWTGRYGRRRARDPRTPRRRAAMAALE